MPLRSDLHSDFGRYRKVGVRPFSVILFCQGYWATLTYRLCRAVSRRTNFLPVRPIAGFFCRCATKWMEILTGISLPPQCEIGPGLYIPHFGTIVINGGARIGPHCTIHQGVTIGTAGRRERSDCPILGSRVYIGVNATLVGKITVGDDAVIGAGAVVTKSVPARAVVVGNPATVVSYRGSFDFLQYEGMETDTDRIASLESAKAAQNVSSIAQPAPAE